VLETSLAPYLLWAKTRRPAAIDLAGSNLAACTLADLPGAAEAMAIAASNDLGYPPLVDAIAAHAGVSRDRVVTAQGCSGANFLAIAALVGAGDEVLLEQPGYDPLAGACRLMGARVVPLRRRVEDGFALSPEALASRLTARTRLVIITTPHNPSGVMTPASTVARLVEIADRAGAHVIVDEVYLDAANVANGTSVVSAATLEGPVVVTNSLTKSYGLAGLRCGWAIAPSATAERLRRTRDVVDNIGAVPAEALSALAFAHLPQLAERARSILAPNLARARAFLDAHPQLRTVEPPGASVMFPRLVGVEDAEPFVRHLLDTEQVAVAPGRFFDEPAHLRISLAGPRTTLDEGLTRAGRALQSFARL